MRSPILLLLPSASFLVLLLLLQLSSTLARPSPDPGHLYRAINSNEAQTWRTNGLNAQNPGSTHRSPSDHTDGWTDSQYISTTTDKKRAQQINKDGDNAGVLKINTDKIPGFHNDGHVDMVKHTEGSSGLTKTWANFNKEVLVKNHIPADACKLIRRDVGDLFRRAAGCARKKSAGSGSPKTAAGKGAAGSTQSARAAKPAAKSTAAAPAAKKATKPASGGGRKK
ncbi:hypothetical protein DFJ73DRAFT_909513 [Zopfochytrium polystomum]|nr:hypothetical protein DFJ73DRAFT_909513 [Zopfochytrium polystomum]